MGKKSLHHKRRSPKDISAILVIYIQINPLYTIDKWMTREDHSMLSNQLYGRYFDSGRNKIYWLFGSFWEDLYNTG